MSETLEQAEERLGDSLGVRWSGPTIMKAGSGTDKLGQVRKAWYDCGSLEEIICLAPGNENPAPEVWPSKTHPFELAPPDLPEPPEPLTGVVRGMDVSSHQVRDLTAYIQQFRPSHVVVKAYQEIESVPQSCTIQQMHSALANGCSVGAYVWLYHGISPAQQVQQALEVAERAGVTLPLLWIDLETYQGTAPTIDEAEAACAACDQRGIRSGIYTGNWFVDAYWHGQIGRLVEYPVWLAAYDGLEQLDTPSPYWPREMVKGHQYSSSPIDLNAFAREVTEPSA